MVHSLIPSPTLRGRPKKARGLCPNFCRLNRLILRPHRAAAEL
jgi:hypothetical protein